MRINFGGASRFLPFATRCRLRCRHLFARRTLSRVFHISVPKAFGERCGGFLDALSQRAVPFVVEVSDRSERGDGSHHIARMVEYRCAKTIDARGQAAARPRNAVGTYFFEQRVEFSPERRRRRMRRFGSGANLFVQLLLQVWRAIKGGKGAAGGRRGQRKDNAGAQGDGDWSASFDPAHAGCAVRAPHRERHGFSDPFAEVFEDGGGQAHGVESCEARESQFQRKAAEIVASRIRVLLDESWAEQLREQAALSQELIELADSIRLAAQRYLDADQAF